MNWDYFDSFHELNTKYLPTRGEGDTQATQICTAVNKLVYKWYNDGDVYDNVRSPMTGWLNDLSSYANWMWNNTRAGDVLERIFICADGEEYEDLLVDLADMLLTKEVLEHADTLPKTGSVYKCDGPFEFSDEEDEDDDW